MTDTSTKGTARSQRRTGRGAGRALKLLLAAAVAGGLAACGGSDGSAQAEEEAESGRYSLSKRSEARAGMSARTTTALDSGNAAYRRGEYERARHHYRSAVEESPENAAAWLGVYMAERALGNRAAADSARKRAEALSPDVSAFHGSPHGKGGPDSGEGAGGGSSP